jgi:hypothetical protein
MVRGARGRSLLVVAACPAPAEACRRERERLCVPSGSSGISVGRSFGVSCRRGGGGGTVSFPPVLAGGATSLASIIGGHDAHSAGHCRQQVEK